MGALKKGMDTTARIASREVAALAAPLDIAAIVGPAAWSRLPQAVRRRFDCAHHDSSYTGSLDLTCSRVGRCFALLTGIFGGPLTGVRSNAVPACVRVYGNGRGGVVWERHLNATTGSRVVRSTKLKGDEHTLIERTDGGLSMELDVFEESGALVFRSRRYFLAWGAWRLPIPMLLTPGVCRVEHRDQGDGRFIFTLTMIHPWWGKTFQQSGSFADPKEDFA
jgi:hypothetical protein